MKLIHHSEFAIDDVSLNDETLKINEQFYLQGPEMLCTDMYQSFGALWCHLSFENMENRPALQSFKKCLDSITDKFDGQSSYSNESVCIRIPDTARVEDTQTTENLRGDDIVVNSSRVVPIIHFNKCTYFKDTLYIPLVAPIIKVRTPENEQTHIDVPSDDFDTDN